MFKKSCICPFIDILSFLGTTEPDLFEMFPHFENFGGEIVEKVPQIMNSSFRWGQTLQELVNLSYEMFRGVREKISFGHMIHLSRNRVKISTENEIRFEMGSQRMSGVCIILDNGVSYKNIPHLGCSVSDNISDAARIWTLHPK